jgi:hypothetical protein
MASGNERALAAHIRQQSLFVRRAAEMMDELAARLERGNPVAASAIDAAMRLNVVGGLHDELMYHLAPRDHAAAA